MEEDPNAKKVCNAFTAVYAGAKDPENIDKDDIKAALEEALKITLRVRRSHDY